MFSTKLDVALKVSPSLQYVMIDKVTGHPVSSTWRSVLQIVSIIYQVVYLELVMDTVLATTLYFISRLLREDCWLVNTSLNEGLGACFKVTLSEKHPSYRLLLFDYQYLYSITSNLLIFMYGWREGKLSGVEDAGIKSPELNQHYIYYSFCCVLNLSLILKIYYNNQKNYYHARSDKITNVIESYWMRINPIDKYKSY